MKDSNNVYNTIDEYIMTFPNKVQEKLKQIRQVIKAAAPEAEERISYQMPTFYLKGNLVHFAAFKPKRRHLIANSFLRVWSSGFNHLTYLF